MENNIKKHSTFFQWRKELRMAPILLEVLDVIESIDDCRTVYKVRWHILTTNKVYTSEFPMVTDIDGRFYEFVPIPLKTYLQAIKMLKEADSSQSARRRILNLMKKVLEL